MKKKLIKSLIFTKTPLKKSYRYKDEFQVYPPDFNHMPKNSRTKHFPVVIEYWINLDENPKETPFGDETVDKRISEATNQTNKLRLLTNLLTTVTNHRFFFYSHPEEAWVIANPEVHPENFNEQPSHWSCQLFYYPEIAEDMKISTFSNVTIPLVGKIPHPPYYYFDPFDNPNKVITFPSKIDEILESYFTLRGKAKKVTDSAIYLLCNALDIELRMKSLSVVSAVSAIETLINYEYRKEKIKFECHSCKAIKTSDYHCQTCGKPIWGLTAKFRKFLSTYVSGSTTSIKKFNKIYNLRSKIVHTDYLLVGDNFIDWSENDKSNELSLLRKEAIQLSRLSIVNWLLAKVS